MNQRYIIVKAEKASALEVRVNQQIDKGYVPSGSMVVIASVASADVHRFFQAMILRDDAGEVRV